MYGLSYGQGYDEFDGAQDKWWVRTPDATGCTVQWFDTQAQARNRYDELLALSKGGQS